MIECRTKSTARKYVDDEIGVILKELDVDKVTRFKQKVIFEIIKCVRFGRTIVDERTRGISNRERLVKKK